MTNEEAIYCMMSYLPERYGATEDCPKCPYYESGCKSDEAHTMAIEALKAEPCADMDFVQTHKKIPVILDITKMRDATAQEREGVREYVESISEITEPCADCVSRKYLIDKAVSWDKHFADGIRYVALTDILNAPPVTPAEKVGMWIEKSDGIGRWWECSQCGAHGGEGMKYCMFCGAKMQEVKE